MTERDKHLIEAVSAAVEARRNDIISLLQELVRIPSENPKLADSSPHGEANVQAFVSSKMMELGATTDQWDALPGRPNLVGTLTGSGNGRSFAINSHIDTVPAGHASTWTHPPFAGDVADGAVWGRGAVDPKGGIAAMLGVVQVLRDLGIALRGDLYLESVVDEEAGGPGTAETIKRGYRPDFVVVCDAAEAVNRITAVEGGLEWLRVTVTGVSGHSAWRYKSVHAGGQGTAVSALDKAVKIVNAVADLERMWAIRKVSPYLPAGITTINVGAMAAGSGGGADGFPNVTKNVSSLPDYCSIDLSLKYLPTETADQVKAEFETYLQHVCELDDWLREHPPTIEWGLHGVSFPPAMVDADHPALQLFAEAVRSFGMEPIIGGHPAVSDIAWFAEEGIPAVLCGPGQGFNAHGADERIDIDSLIECIKTLSLFAIEWCGSDWT